MVVLRSFIILQQMYYGTFIYTHMKKYVLAYYKYHHDRIKTIPQYLAFIFGIIIYSTLPICLSHFSILGNVLMFWSTSLCYILLLVILNTDWLKDAINKYFVKAFIDWIYSDYCNDLIWLCTSLQNFNDVSGSIFLHHHNFVEYIHTSKLETTQPL